MLRGVVLSALGLAAAVGCGTDHAASASVARRPPEPRPDEMPALLDGDLPFRYPGALYVRKVQGNVTLALRVDRDGRVLSDSTRIEEPSGYPELDSAALKGSRDLKFVPAKLRGDPIPVSILFPVYFRHPDARPLPGDSVLQGAKPGA